MVTNSAGRFSVLADLDRIESQADPKHESTRVDSLPQSNWKSKKKKKIEAQKWWFEKFETGKSVWFEIGSGWFGLDYGIREAWTGALRIKCSRFENENNRSVDTKLAPINDRFALTRQRARWCKTGSRCRVIQTTKQLDSRKSSNWCELDKWQTWNGSSNDRIALQDCFSWSKWQVRMQWQRAGRRTHTQRRRARPQYSVHP